MSDQFNAPTTGQDPLGERLRAFGAQNAGSATPLPPVEEIHRGGDRRRRQQRLATGAATVAVVAIVGAVIAGQLGHQGDEMLLPATQTPTQTRMQTPTPSTVDAGRRVDLGGRATVLVPQGWTSQITSDYVDDRAGTTVEMVCLNDAKANGLSVVCDIEIQWGPITMGREHQAWTAGQAGGWYHRTDAAPCFLPGGDPATPGESDIMPADQVPTKSYGPVGSKTAEVYSYAVSCIGGRSFTSTMWWLPTTQLRIHDIVGNPRTKDILASVRFEGE